MDYLTQYYKNRAEQLQQELEQLTEAVLAKGDPGYYEPTNVGILDWFAKRELSAAIKAEMRTLITKMHPSRLNDASYMRNWIDNVLTAEQRAAWKQMFPNPITTSDGTNGPVGRIWWMFMDGDRQRVIFWSESKQGWYSPGKSGISPFGWYSGIMGGEIIKPLQATDTVSSVIKGVGGNQGGNPMTTGPNSLNAGLSSTSNKNDRLV